MKRLAAVGIAMAMLACACGSTVPLAQRRTALATADEFGGADTTALRTTDDTLGVDAAAGPAGASSSGRTTTSGRTATSAARRAAATGTITIGAVAASNASAVLASLGVKAVSTGDQKGFFTAVANYINRTGGINGRQLGIQFHDYNVVGGIANGDAEAQKTCAAFTEDTHVLAVLSPFLTGAVIYQCLANAKTALIDDSTSFFSMADPKLHGYHFSPSYPDTTRAYTAFVNRLVDHGFFGASPKIGLSYLESPSRKIAADAVTKALAARGLKVTANIGYTTAEQVASAVLQFKARGITHVFELEGSGGLETQVFMLTAQAQLYHPRYALTTLSGPNLLQANASPAQLRGAEGIGWIPSADISSVESSPRDKQCLDIIRSANIAIPDSSAGRFALAICDTMFFFAETMRRASTVDVDGFKRAAEAMGTSYVPVGSFASRFGPGHHDGPTKARYLAFDDACTCFKYSGGLLDF